MRTCCAVKCCAPKREARLQQLLHVHPLCFGWLCSRCSVLTALVAVEVLQYGRHMQTVIPLTIAEHIGCTWSDAQAATGKALAHA